METDVSQEYQEYLNEFRILQETKLLDDYLDEIEENSYRSCDEGEQEADWLRAAGLPHLTEPFSQGRELAEHDVEPALRLLPKHQAEAVKRRVRTLNHTVRKRGGRQHRARQRKPDIRDVFKDVENSSTGTRSRSATPDSLDSELPCEDPSPQLPWSYTAASENRSAITAADGQYPSYRSQSKEIVRRQPSASPSNSYGQSILFRHPGAWGGGKGSLALDTEGIEMLNYQPLGTLHLPRPKERIRSGSDPTTSTTNEQNNYNHQQYHYHKPLVGSPPSNTLLQADRIKLHKNPHVSITRSHSNLYNIDPHSGNENGTGHQRVPATRPALRRSGSHGQLGFEDVFQQKYQPFPHEGTSKIKSSVAYSEKRHLGRTWAEFLGEEDLLRLRPLLLMEVTALFDTHNITFHKRKPPKRKRKEEGNVFGVSLESLLMKDQGIASDDVLVPVVIQKLLSHLERHGLREEGILRVPGHEQKVEALRNELEAEFYRHRVLVDQLMLNVSCHDVMAVLKRLLRDLPQPLLTVEYIDMFYQTHALPNKAIQQRALNLLILLLPAEFRNTLRAIFRFLLRIIQNQAHNKMTQHNVAMLIAPSFFIPRYVHPVDKNDLVAQVNLAATCCQLTGVMLQCGEELWVVPEDLIAQIRCQKEEERYRKGHKENNKPMKRLLGKKGGIREPITRKIDNEVDFQDGVIRINAPQFQMSDVPVRLSPETTAGDVVLRIAEEATRRTEVPNAGLKLARRPHDIKSRALAELAPNGNLSCILATGYPEITLQTHFLYEIGGNIAQRQVEHNAILLAVYKENPNAQWTLRCHHRHANNTVPIH